MYKTGDKFIIELGEQVGNLWKIKGFNALVFDDFGLDRLNRLTQGVDVFSHYKGAEAAWELAKKVSLMSGFTYGELREIFGISEPAQVYKLTYAGAAAKVAEWEKKKTEICVGDVVTDVVESRKMIVTSIEDTCAACVRPDGSCGIYFKEDLTKTDRHIDIESVLAQIK